MHDVKVGDLNVWHRPGDHSPTVLIAGLTGNSRWWRRVIEHLPDGLEILAMDVRGRAGSDEAPPPFDMKTLADDIVSVLDHFDIDRATVVGYSMGAWIAATFGERHPDRAVRLLLVDGGLEVPAPPDMDTEDIINAVVGPSLARLDMTFATTTDVAAYWQGHPALTGYWDDSMLDCLTHELAQNEDGYHVRANPEAILLSGQEITVSRELDTAVLRQQVPAHIIVVERGTADQPGGMIPLAAAEEASLRPHITFQFVPDVNHYTLVLGKGAPTVAAAIAATS